MATIKFDRQDVLDELIARIYLDLKIKFTKKMLLEVIFDLGSEDYQLLLSKIQHNYPKDEISLRNQFIETFSAALDVEESDNIDPKSIWVSQIEEKKVKKREKK
ncbi:MAG: hypothetical protein ACTSYI_04390 [Promethearchaeota archaeon]